MAYSEDLASRIRSVLATRPDVAERKMFGGLCFLIGGNMACGIVGHDLMLRVGAEAAETLLGKPHTREMDFTGKPMRGMLYVAPAGIRTKRQLSTWLHHGIRYAESLPAK